MQCQKLTNWTCKIVLEPTVVGLAILKNIDAIQFYSFLLTSKENTEMN